MKIGYDISQTGSGKAGCGFFAHSLLNSIVDDTSYHFVLYPSFGDFYFDQGLQSSTDYRQGNVVYRGACEDKAKASAFWHLRLNVI